MPFPLQKLVPAKMEDTKEGSSRLVERFSKLGLRVFSGPVFAHTLSLP